MPKRTIWIGGVKDPFIPEDVMGWILIEKLGHFPQDENPSEFQKVIQRFLTQPVFK